MSQGKYSRRRCRRLNYRFVLLILIFIILLAVLGTVLLHACRSEDIPSASVQPSQTLAPSTVPSTVPSAAPTTLPTAVPTTEPTTAPTAEPTTEPTTEATTEPTTVPTAAPTTAPTEPPNPPSSAIGAQVAQLAIDQLGKPYAYGGIGPDNFDASGLVVYCFSQNGVELPRTTPYQASSGTAVPRDSIEPGDVLFFWSENPGEAEYEGIYIGGGKFIAARHGDNPVTEMDFTAEYFSSRFVCARRYG